MMFFMSKVIYMCVTDLTYLPTHSCVNKDKKSKLLLNLLNESVNKTL